MDRPRLQLVKPPIDAAPTQAFDPALKSGGGGGTFDGMLESRVARLEEDMKEVRSDLKAIRTDLAEVKGRLSAMPTAIQLLGFVVAIFVAAGILKYFGH